MRSLRARARRKGRQPGTAACLGAVVVMLAVAARWLLRVWVTPFADGTPFVYGACILRDWGSSCGLGVVAALAVFIATGRPRLPRSWIEGLRLALGAYWVALFLVLGAIALF